MNIFFGILLTLSISLMDEIGFKAGVLFLNLTELGFNTINKYIYFRFFFYVYISYIMRINIFSF